MSDNTTCHHCGAPIEPNTSVCPYCGSAVAVIQSASTYGKWIRVDDHMPPMHPSISDRTIDVYVNNGFSLYYDFKKKKWDNDFYKEKLLWSKIPELNPWCWTTLPTYTAPKWISVNDCSPEIDIEGALSIDVLTCRKGPNYESSIMKANISYRNPFDKIGFWTGGINMDSDNYEDRKIDVTHWMSLPPNPQKLFSYKKK